MDDLQIYERFLKETSQLKDFQLFKLGNQKRSSTVRIKRRLKRFHPLIDLNENQFRLQYRFTKENFRRIIEVVRDDMELDLDNDLEDRNQVPIDLQILAAIRLWGNSEHPQLTAMAHGVSMHTMAKISRRVASVLSLKASRYIRMPVTLSEKELVMRSFQELSNMPQVIGAIIQTCVRIRAESQMHLQLVCDAAHKFRDLDLRLADELDLNTAMEMFSLSRIKERLEQNEFRGRIILGNQSLRCSSSLFTPIQCPRNQSEELYNRAHAATYKPAIDSIDLWMRRFGILGSDLLGSLGSVKQTITALALLHNMAMDWNDPSLNVDSTNCVFRQFSFNNFATEEQRTRSEFIKSHFECESK